jgi:hypothetical protein
MVVAGMAHQTTQLGQDSLEKSARVGFFAAARNLI